MMLIINLCKHELHYFEFVKPVEDVVVKTGMSYVVVNINYLTKEHLNSADKVIICGTSLRDFDYEKKDFSWIKNYEKPLLGICAGFQVICKSYGFKTKKSTEIGLKSISFNKKFMGINEEKQVYCLHNNIIEKNAKFSKEFEVYSNSENIQAIKKHTKKVYATLFHPEVRNKALIENFLYI